ncbi:MAG: hypothetical protein HZA50_10200 [Planctomycetes bacterium]|nr:hypothetical protein [Planctomycetota bacterium]
MTRISDIEVETMKNLILTLALCMAGLLGGCGLVDTYQQRERRYAVVTDQDFRQMIDDWDCLWLYDRNMRLTEYHPRSTE